MAAERYTMNTSNPLNYNKRLTLKTSDAASGQLQLSVRRFTYFIISFSL